MISVGVFLGAPIAAANVSERGRHGNKRHLILSLENAGIWSMNRAVDGRSARCHYT
jgi:hypothetical protein